MGTGNADGLLAAGIVAYYPESDALTHLVETLAPQVDCVFLFRNSPVQTPALADLAHRVSRQLVLLGDETNVGLGVAYNSIFAAAQERGIGRVLLFDQDLVPLATHAATLGHRLRGLADRGLKPAVIGPLPLSGQGRAYKAPRSVPRPVPQLAPQVPVEFVISSGALIDVVAFAAVGPFREDFFIDAIDIEWCFRARALGLSCWIASDVPMRHKLGLGIIRLPILNLHLARQPPRRLYTFIRNQLAMLRLCHVPWKWKIRIVPLVIVHSIVHPSVGPCRRALVRSVFGGWADGLRGALGPP